MPLSGGLHCGPHWAQVGLCGHCQLHADWCALLCLTCHSSCPAGILRTVACEADTQQPCKCNGGWPIRGEHTRVACAEVDARAQRCIGLILWRVAQLRRGTLMGGCPKRRAQWVVKAS